MSTNELIAIVDDDDGYRAALKSLMMSLGLRAESFESAVDYLSSKSVRSTSCLIADVHMPSMTGPELHSHLLTSGFAIPTILITAYPDDDVRARAMATGVICYLSKTSGEDVLVHCVRSALRKSTQTERSL